MINKDTALDFLEFGITTKGSSLFRDYETVHLSLYNTYPDIFNSHSIDQDLKLLAKKIYQSLEASIDTFVRNDSFDAVALSGGVDTRLILSILLKNHPSVLHNKYLYTRVHPNLDSNTDQDVILVKKLAKKFNLNIQIEKPKLHSNGYLIRDNQQSKTLSGLWGGELLGGQVRDNQTCQLQSILNSTRNSPLKEVLNNEISSNTLNDNTNFFIYFFLLRNSNITSFYQTPIWLKPSFAESVAVTPFLDDHFLSTLTKCPARLLYDYQIYQYILEHYCTDLLDIEILSYGLKENDLITLVKQGTNAKKIARVNNLKTYNSPLKDELTEFIKGNLHLPYSKYALEIMPYIDPDKF
jgi:hypothetical protein